MIFDFIRKKFSRVTQAHNLYHPEYFNHVEKAFTSGGVHYYNFKGDTMIRTGRYLFIQNFLQEVNHRMDGDRLEFYIKRIISELDNSKGTINVGNALVFLNQMLSLKQLAFEPDTVYRLASAVYFDDTEDLRKWDGKHNEQKIASWRENGTLDFFLCRPFIELIGLKDTSKTVIQDYLDKADELIKSYNSVLNYVTPKQSSKSSMMNA